MSTLVARPALPWPALLDELPATLAPLRRHIIERACRDVLMVENPLGSNRGRRLDTYLRRAHVPESLIVAGKGWWCGAAVGTWFIDGGAKVPADFASCDAWLPFLEPAGYAPEPGDAILYGVRGDAHHIGLVVLTVPLLLTCEGNRAYAGTTNNGIAVDIAPPMRRDILGYIRPVAA